MNVPDLPGPSVDGETVATPLSRTCPRRPYQVRAAPTAVTVVVPLFLTVPRSVTVPFVWVVLVSVTRLSGRDRGALAVVTW